MIDRQITAAALRWHTAHTKRLTIGAERRKEQQAAMQRIGYASASAATDKRLSEAKRIERAALRNLAKLCAKVRDSQHDVVDADVIDLPMLLIG